LYGKRQSGKKIYENCITHIIANHRAPLPFPSGLLFEVRSVPPVALPPLTPPDLVPAPFPLLLLLPAVLFSTRLSLSLFTDIFVFLRANRRGFDSKKGRPDFRSGRIMMDHFT
jgi:hypothetical protein